MLEGWSVASWVALTAALKRMLRDCLRSELCNVQEDRRLTFAVGARLGASEGPSEGFQDGEMLGPAEGLKVGSFVGLDEGYNDLVLVQTRLNQKLSWQLTCFTGVRDGDAVTGSVLGLSVGAFEGMPKDVSLGVSGGSVAKVDGWAS